MHTNAAGVPQIIAAFYQRNLRAMQFGAAVAQIIIVPILALNVMG